jgi:hypothetical protein
MTPEEEIASLKLRLMKETDRSRSYRDIYERQNSKIAELCQMTRAPRTSPHDIHTLETCIRRLRAIADPFIK